MKLRFSIFAVIMVCCSYPVLAGNSYDIQCTGTKTVNGATVMVTAGFNSPFLPNGAASIKAFARSSSGYVDLGGGVANVAVTQKGSTINYVLTNSYKAVVATFAMTSMTGTGRYFPGGPIDLTCQIGPKN